VGRLHRPAAVVFCRSYASCKARADALSTAASDGLYPFVRGLARRLCPAAPGICPVTARTVQGMARVRSGQAPAWPLVSDWSARRGSRVKRDFACTFTRPFPPVLVVLRSQSRLRLEGRARTLSGPSPDLARPRRPLVCMSASDRLPDRGNQGTQLTDRIRPAQALVLSVKPLGLGRLVRLCRLPKESIFQ
jgi:hypothetical protein